MLRRRCRDRAASTLRRRPQSLGIQTACGMWPLSVRHTPAEVGPELQATADFIAVISLSLPRLAASQSRALSASAMISIEAKLDLAGTLPAGCVQEAAHALLSGGVWCRVFSLQSFAGKVRKAFKDGRTANLQSQNPYNPKALNPYSPEVPETPQ